MKKLFLISAILLATTLCFGQTAIQSIDTSTHKIVYAEIMGIGKLFSKNVTITIDFGERTKFVEDTRLREKDGTLKVFNSMVDAMNFMGSEGWSFLQAYVVTVGNQNVYHFLLNKVIDKQALIDFDTKKDFKK